MFIQCSINDFNDLFHNFDPASYLHGHVPVVPVKWWISPQRISTLHSHDTAVIRRFIIVIICEVAICEVAACHDLCYLLTLFLNAPDLPGPPTSSYVLPITSICHHLQHSFRNSVCLSTHYTHWSHMGLIGLIGGTGLGLSELLALGDGAEPSKPVMASAPTMGHSMAPTVAGQAHCHAPHAVPSQKPCVCRAYAMRCRLPRGPAFSSSRNQGTAALSNPDERPSGDSKVISKYLQIKLHITLQGRCVVLKIEVTPKVVRKQRSESCISVLRFEIC